MPTAGRLTAALALALLGGYLAYLTSPLFEEGSLPGFWWPLCILAGVWAGWVVMGKRAGRGYSAAVGNGFTGVAAQVFWILFLTAGADMLQKSMRRSYDGPIEAVIDVFQLMWEYAQDLGTQEVGVALVVGAICAAFFSEFYAKRFP
ncbi:TrgA family protein [Yoonia sp. R2331]|uniref:TrgA family protein n=1 Tax=Yoonia sp. R2331 TaxID=3237238 RepID=UPI0034E5DB9F